MNSLLVRSISGAVYVAIVVGCVLSGSLGTLLLASIIAILAMIELTKITTGEHDDFRFPTFFTDLLGCLTIVFASIIPDAFLLWVAFYIIRVIEELYLKSENPLQNLAMSLFRQIYIGMPLYFMPVIAGDSGFGLSEANPLLAVFIFIWLSDTGAYLVGSSIGKRPLFKRISPNKSWEGFIGGLVISLIVSQVICFNCPEYFGFSGNPILWGLFAIVVVIFSTWGDLLESMIKRTIGIKDAGNLIPGHGGILDRIDSLLLALPAAALLLEILK